MQRLVLQQKLQQKLSPQQIQLMKLLQVPTVSLEQRIKEEMEINPALEEGVDEEEKEKTDEDELTQDDSYLDSESDDEHKRDDFNLDQYIDDDETPSYKLSIKNKGEDDDRKEIPFAGGTTFQEQLMDQLRLRDVNSHQQVIAEYIIGNIDEDGYMRRELAAMVDDLAFTQNIETTEEELEYILKEIHELDPPGIGARNLQECLLIQLRRKDKKRKAIRFAIEIVDEAMEEFVKKHYDKIAKKLELTDDELKMAISEIIHLNPKPGNSGHDGHRSTQHVTPDFILVNNDNKLELTLNSRNAPELKVSREYMEMLKDYSKSKDKSNKDAIMFIKQKIDSAKWFIDAIQQRQQTLMFVMNAILKYQYDYFQEGDETRLRPMILKDIADVTGLDISTISRVANSKYIQTHFGTLPLKSFFSESLSTDSGEEVSTREVKKILQDSIAAEDKSKPLPDEDLVKVLKEKGYNIARRTVAKYREQLGIPVARLRKEL